MKIRKIDILNFRGIKLLEWKLPDQQVFCLIGKGDSAKTTILEAIRCTFSPQWNLPFNDSDFHLCNTDHPIRIEVVIGELPNEFCSEQKYGTCRVPCDHVLIRSWPLMRARELMRGVIESFRQEQRA